MIRWGLPVLIQLSERHWGYLIWLGLLKMTGLGSFQITGIISDVWNYPSLLGGISSDWGGGHQDDGNYFCFFKITKYFRLFRLFNLIRIVFVWLRLFYPTVSKGYGIISYLDYYFIWQGLLFQQLVSFNLVGILFHNIKKKRANCTGTAKVCGCLFWLLLQAMKKNCSQ